MHPRHSRRTLRFAIGALLLAAPVLTSCGFDYATDRINSHTAGTNEHDGDVDVLNALVVAAQPGSGTLVGLLSNNVNDEEGVLTSVTSGPDAVPADVEPLEVPPGGATNLEDAGIRIEGDVEAGTFIDVTLTFENGDEIAIAVPVVTACGQYDGRDDAPSATADGGEGDGEETDETEDANAYSCEAEEAPEH